MPKLLALLSIVVVAGGATGCVLIAGDPDEKAVSAFNTAADYMPGHPRAESADCKEDSDLGDRFEGATFYDCRITYVSGGSAIWCFVRAERDDRYGAGSQGTCREAAEGSKPPS
jgi:hypothetical protein